MSMLDRYRKSGGFLQLLNLMETCGPAKQEKFLQIVREEDPLWAATIERKMLSIGKIFAWPPEALAEISGCVQDLTLGVALHGLDPAQRENLFKTLSHGQRRKVEEVFETSKPTTAEISTMMMKIIEETRKLISDGKLRMDKVDPGLVVEDDIEDQLRKGSYRPKGASAPISAEPEPAALNFDMADHMAPVADSAAKDEIINLRKKLLALGNENNQLRQELHRAYGKLEQIKKLVE